MKTKDDVVFERWAQWFKVLDNEVLNLMTQQQVFHSVQEIIRDNPTIQEPNDFNFWMAVWYSSSLSIAVRKQSDKSTGSVSYINLLQEIKENPTIISRTRYKSTFCDHNYTADDADRDLDRVFGTGKAHVDPNAVEREIDELIKTTDPLRKFVNKRIAHHDHREFEAVPTFADLNDAIKFLGTLHQKYFEIFEGLSTVVLPEWNYDWKAVFRHPWIP